MKLNKVELVYYRHNFYGNVKNIGKGIILFNELTLVNKGSMLYTVNGCDYEVSEGEAIFLPYGSERSRASGCVADFVSFNFIGNDDFGMLKTITHGFIDDEVVALLKICDLFEKNGEGSFNQKCEGVLRAILVKAFDYYTNPQYSPLTISIIKILEKNILTQIQLKDIERDVFFTSNYFAKIFKRETGYSIIKYYNFLKLEKAKQLINEQEKTLEEISTLLGFSDYNYFSRLFKKYYGISPNEYKKQYLIKL